MNLRVLVGLSTVAAAVSLAAPYPAAAIPHATTPVTDQTRETLLPSGTLIRIAMKDTVSSARNKAGDVFAFTVVDDVKIGDRIAIPAGSSGTGKVLQSAPAHG